MITVLAVCVPIAPPPVGQEVLDFPGRLASGFTPRYRPAIAPG
ncbi:MULTISPECIES: hypothetical protein [unclassified Streptomyces]